MMTQMAPFILIDISAQMNTLMLFCKKWMYDVSKKGLKRHGFKVKIPSVTLANYVTTVIGNYGKIMKLQIVLFTIRLHL